MLSHNNLVLSDDIENAKIIARTILQGCCTNLDRMFSEEARAKNNILFSRAYESLDILEDFMGALALMKSALDDPNHQRLLSVFTGNMEFKSEYDKPLSKEALQLILMRCAGKLKYGESKKQKVFFNYGLLYRLLSSPVSLNDNEIDFTLDLSFMEKADRVNASIWFPFLEENNYTQRLVEDGDKIVVSLFVPEELRLESVSANTALANRGITSQVAEFFIGCVEQCIKLPIECANELMSFISDPVSYSKNLVDNCPGYFPKDSWKKIHVTNSQNHFFAVSTNASLCEQLSAPRLQITPK